MGETLSYCDQILAKQIGKLTDILKISRADTPVEVAQQAKRVRQFAG
jgi:hypothetical protein